MKSARLPSSYLGSPPVKREHACPQRRHLKNRSVQKYLTAVTTYEPPQRPQPIPSHLFAPFFLAATTLKYPFPPPFAPAASSLPDAPASFTGPFFATSLQPPDLSTPTLRGLELFGTALSRSPLSARRLRRMNSSAKWRESIVLEAPCTASVMMSVSGGRKTRELTNSSAGETVSVSTCN